MKNPVLFIALVLIFVASAKSHAFMGNDDGSRDLMIVLTSKQVDDHLQSLRTKVAIPTRIRGVTLDHCNVTPASCTYKLKFSALGADVNDDATYNCFFKLDVDMNGKISNFGDTRCMPSGKILGR